MLALLEFFWDAWPQGATVLTAETGAFTEAGQTVELRIGLAGANGGFAEGGQSGILDVRVSAGAGVYAFTGQDVADYSTSAVEAPIVPTVRTGGGGGHKRLPEDFWWVREEYLKRLKADAEEVVPHEVILETVGQLDSGLPAVQAIAEAVAERERAYRAAESARTTAALNVEATRIIALTQKIAKLKMQKDEDDAILMLLMVL